MIKCWQSICARNLFAIWKNCFVLTNKVDRDLDLQCPSDIKYKPYLLPRRFLPKDSEKDLASSTPFAHLSCKKTLHCFNFMKIKN